MIISLTPTLLVCSILSTQPPVLHTHSHVLNSRPNHLCHTPTLLVCDNVGPTTCVTVHLFMLKLYGLMQSISQSCYRQMYATKKPVKELGHKHQATMLILWSAKTIYWWTHPFCVLFCLVWTISHMSTKLTLKHPTRTTMATVCLHDFGRTKQRMRDIFWFIWRKKWLKKLIY